MGINAPPADGPTIHNLICALKKTSEENLVPGCQYQHYGDERSQCCVALRPYSSLAT